MNLKHMCWVVALSVLSVTAQASEPKPYSLTLQFLSKPSPQLHLVIRPQKGLAFKKETPFKAELKSALPLSQTLFTGKDLKTNAQGEKYLETLIQKKVSGKQQLTAELSFFLCTEQLCERYQDTVTLEFKAEEPSSK